MEKNKYYMKKIHCDNCNETWFNQDTRVFKDENENDYIDCCYCGENRIYLKEVE